VEGIVAETPSLLALSSDLDWQQSVSELREEALGGLSARGEREMALARLGDFMDGRLHDRLLESVLQPSLLLQGGQDPQEELGVRIRVEELRWQATLQVSESADLFMNHRKCFLCIMLSKCFWNNRVFLKINLYRFLLSFVMFTSEICN